MLAARTRAGVGRPVRSTTIESVDQLAAAVLALRRDHRGRRIGQEMLGVEAIVIRGGLSERLCAALTERIAAELAPRVFVPRHWPMVLGAELGDLSAAVGAVALAGA